MKKQFKFKQGFANRENNNISLTMKLSVSTENMENKDILRLVNAMDREYKQLIQEKCSENESNRKEFKQWQMVFD